MNHPCVTVSEAVLGHNAALSFSEVVDYFGQRVLDFNEIGLRWPAVQPSNALQKLVVRDYMEPAQECKLENAFFLDEERALLWLKNKTRKRTET